MLEFPAEATPSLARLGQHEEQLGHRVARVRNPLLLGISLTEGAIQHPNGVHEREAATDAGNAIESLLQFGQGVQRGRFAKRGLAIGA